MDVTYAGLSSTGPVRQNNEDFLGFWEPADAGERLARGAVAIVADGVGGQAHGEKASRAAVETATRVFAESRPGMSASGLLWQMFNAANLAVYNLGLDENTQEGRMATTMSVTLFRNDEVSVGHVGDSRIYLIHDGGIKALTTDHTYLAFHARVGLMSPAEIAASPMGNALTRSIGKEPTVRADIVSHRVTAGDVILQCTDGLHNVIDESQLAAVLRNKTPEQACQDMIALAHSRGTTDNVSVQVVRVDKVEQLTYYRGTPVVQKQETKPPAAPDAEVGQVLDGRFRIQSLISRSGMASVFKATDLSDGRTVALKIPFMQFESDPAFYSRFEREEAIGRGLDHPYILYIVPVEAGKKSRPYIAMEYLEGDTLDKVMTEHRPMPQEEAVGFVTRIAEALEHMHARNVVHRDLKPSNIMVCKDGSIRVMDFGIAKAAGMRRITFAGFSPAMGTPDYMAPEQVKGKRGDQRTDLYSLGAILYEMLTGSVPFEGPNPFAVMNARVTGDPIAPRRLNAEISPQMEEIILHAMERLPGDRYGNAQELLKDLRNPEAVHLTGRHQRLREPAVWQSRFKTVLLYSLIPVVVILVMVIAWLLTHRGK